MPSKRKHINRHPTPTVTAEERAWLLDEPNDLFLSLNRRELLWKANAAWVIAQFVAEHPGRRPRGWWKYDSPEPRKRISGVGSAMFSREGGAYIRGNFSRGIPGLFMDSGFAEFCRSRGLSAEAFDPANPATYEGEATYLRRLGLFLPGEERRVPAEAWQPHVVQQRKIVLDAGGHVVRNDPPPKGARPRAVE